MNVEEMRELVQTITYPDYNFEVTEDSRGSVYLRATYLEADIVTKKPELQYTRRWLLSPAMVKSEIVQTVFKCVMTSAEHRVREHFKYRGARVFGPHLDVDALVEICEAKRLDYRGK
jgi:hypothetical protein